ncbi:MAG: saccharopine dehydrogenase C-terminal domain-containing protein [Nitrososphaerota archaeon]
MGGYDKGARTIAACISLKGVEVAILGSGQMGSALAFDLAKSKEVSRVIVIDASQNRIEETKRRLKEKKFDFYLLPVDREKEKISELLKEVDVCIGALPHEIAIHGVECAARAGTDMIDLITMWRYDETSWRKLDSMFRKAERLLISPVGLAPGLSNILAGRGVTVIEDAYKVKILVGAIPSKPLIPLGYRALWSLEGLWDMYVRESLIKVNGKAKFVAPLSGLEIVKFGKIKLEAFYTDGLSTLIKTMDQVKEMYEKTLRWPGHAEKIRTLIECGLLDDQPLPNLNISPRRILNLILAPKLRLKEGETDTTILRVDIEGRHRTCRFELVDEYDKLSGITSLARTTAYPASVIAQMVGKKVITGSGFLPPEEAVSADVYRIFIDELAKRKIKIKQRISQNSILRPFPPA